MVCHDWFSYNIGNGTIWLAEFKGKPGVRAWRSAPMRADQRCGSSRTYWPMRPVRLTAATRLIGPRQEGPAFNLSGLDQYG